MAIRIRVVLQTEYHAMRILASLCVQRKDQEISIVHRVSKCIRVCNRGKPLFQNQIRTQNKSDMVPWYRAWAEAQQTSRARVSRGVPAEGEGQERALTKRTTNLS